MADRESRELARRIAEIAAEYKAENPVLMDLDGLNDAADIFVLLTGMNRQHVHALVDHLREDMRKRYKIRPTGIDGRQSALWVCIDFDSVWVHIFTDELRDYYDLEGLWKDAPRIPFDPDAALHQTAAAAN